ncbi:hypothetical protein [Natrinema altunense]|uniref:Uncharacterized protein n=1 Tax=Natrinema altunense (strain JCM 12890 / CGMCC 1.3731 / AJ2) TaxID=1227494 RepID=L9ZIJ3_NATA2|nr:hypothetical protein [Natrinema altunense]ELY85871.1 hypothetical protein C485_11738 [Natrinema altunense JCM 12890]
MGVGIALEIEHLLFGVLVMVVIPIRGPQLYLAAADGDDEFAPRTRVRTAVGVSPFLLLSFMGAPMGPTGRSSACLSPDC